MFLGILAQLHSPSKYLFTFSLGPHIIQKPPLKKFQPSLIDSDCTRKLCLAIFSRQNQRPTAPPQLSPSNRILIHIYQKPHCIF